MKPVKLTNTMFDAFGNRSGRHILVSPHYVSNGEWMIRLDAIGSWHSDPVRLIQLIRLNHDDDTIQEHDDDYMMKVFPKHTTSIKLIDKREKGVTCDYYAYEDRRGYHYHFQARYIEMLHKPPIMYGQCGRGGTDRDTKRSGGTFGNVEQDYLLCSLRA